MQIFKRVTVMWSIRRYLRLEFLLSSVFLPPISLPNVSYSPTLLTLLCTPEIMKSLGEDDLELLSSLESTWPNDPPTKWTMMLGLYDARSVRCVWSDWDILNYSVITAWVDPTRWSLLEYMHLLIRNSVHIRITAGPSFAQDSRLKKVSSSYHWANTHDHQFFFPAVLQSAHLRKSPISASIDRSDILWLWSCVQSSVHPLPAKNTGTGAL